MFTLCVILWFSMMFIENTFFNMSTYGTAINALIVKYSSQLFKYIYVFVSIPCSIKPDLCQFQKRILEI